MIKLIWAQTQKGVIGRDNRLPWNIKAEMQHFRSTTLNHTILMGRKTFVSMGSKQLPNRVNYVLTNNLIANQQNQNNLYFINDLSDLIDQYKQNPNQDLYVIGGNMIFKLLFDHADEIIRTIINQDYPGNVWIENFNYVNFDKISIVEHEEFYIEHFKRRKANG